MKIKYRPEIDGLRAIAVFAVIFYHIELPFLSPFFRGGFIGVDIFFVISGYLLTLIILKELETDGKFSFSNFYERRARRILPTLFFVMLVSLPFAWMYLIPTTFVDFAKTLFSRTCSSRADKFYRAARGKGFRALRAKIQKYEIRKSPASGGFFLCVLLWKQ